MGVHRMDKKWYTPDFPGVCFLYGGLVWVRWTGKELESING